MATNPRARVVPTAGIAGVLRRSLRTALSQLGRDARFTGTPSASVFTVKLGGCRAVVAIRDDDRHRPRGVLDLVFTEAIPQDELVATMHRIMTLIADQADMRGVDA